MSNRTAYYEPHIATFGAAQPRARILVVDDDACIRELYMAVLTREGYEVEMAEDGANALEQMAYRQFDLVLTDRCMPVLDGERMVLALRSAGIRTPVVMISGSLAHSPLCAHVVRELSAALTKPIHLTEILAAVFAALPPARRRFATAA